MTLAQLGTVTMLSKIFESSLASPIISLWGSSATLDVNAAKQAASFEK